MYIKNKSEFIILKLVYATPDEQPEGPLVSNYRLRDIPVCTYESVRDWYCRIMHRESPGIPWDYSTRFSVWKVITSNADMFTLDSIRYDRVNVFLGEDKMYFMYYQNEPHKTVEGMADLTTKYCERSFGNHYTEAMNI
ncbi:hypothetical protein DOY81_012008 [Sarcophaga bullata]|nr:hypothetical protein DOY81_012008 [Sarcophaga bullata]